MSGLLLLATLAVTFVFTLMNGEWIGLAVAMAVAVAVLVLASVLSRRIALAVSGLVFLAGLGFSAWLSGGWINVAGIAVMAVVAVVGFAWARSRRKPPAGPDGAQREDGPPAPTAPPGASGRYRELPAWPIKPHPPQHIGCRGCCVPGRLGCRQGPGRAEPVQQQAGEDLVKFWQGTAAAWWLATR